MHIHSKSEEKEKFSFEHITCKTRDYPLMLTYFDLSCVSSDPGRFIGQPGCQARSPTSSAAGHRHVSQLEPPLLQEEKDDSKNGDEDGDLEMKTGRKFSTLYRKSDLCIPRNEPVRPRSQFLHS